MPGSFAVDPTTLHRAAPSFADAAQELTQALAHLRSVLADCADMCGDDEHGRAFAAHYQPRAASVHGVLDLGGPAVDRIGTGRQHHGLGLHPHGRRQHPCGAHDRRGRRMILDAGNRGGHGAVNPSLQAPIGSCRGCGPRWLRRSCSSATSKGGPSYGKSIASAASAAPGGAPR
jgi:hypothetical protein